MAEDRDDQTKTHAQHPIPQNVMAVEFKLIGSLTLRQFVFLGAFWGLAFLIYQSILPSFIRAPLAAMVALLGAFISLVPIQDRAADVWLKNFLLAVSQPTERVWRKSRANLDVFWELKEARTVIKEDKGGGGLKDRSQLFEYLKDKPLEIQNPLDLAEHEFLKSVRLLQDDVVLPPGLTAQAIPAALSPVEGPELKARAEVVISPSLASDVNLTPEKIIALPSLGKQKRFVTSIQNVRSGRRLRLLKPGEVGVAIFGEKKIASPEKRAQELAQKIVDLNQRLTEIPTRLPESALRALSDSGSRLPLQKNVETTIVLTAPTRLPESTDKTPGVGTDAPNLAQASSADETQINKSQEAPRSDSGQAGQMAFLSEQLQKLQAEKTALATEVQKERQARLEAETLAGLSEEYQRRLAETVSLNSQFSGQLRQAQAELKSLQEKSTQTSVEKDELQKQIRTSQRRVEDLAREKSQATDNLINLQKELRELRLEQRFAPPPTTPQKTGPTKPESITLAGPKTLPFVKEANIINGYVKDKAGNLLKNAVVIVRDAQEAPVRALKTNELGRFAITTPVANGHYRVEATSEGEAFAIIAVEVFGEILDPLEFLAS